MSRYRKLIVQQSSVLREQRLFEPQESEPTSLGLYPKRFEKGYSMNSQRITYDRDTIVNLRTSANEDFKRIVEIPREVLRYRSSTQSTPALPVASIHGAGSNGEGNEPKILSKIASYPNTIGGVTVAEWWGGSIQNDGIPVLGSETSKKVYSPNCALLESSCKCRTWNEEHSLQIEIKMETRHILKKVPSSSWNQSDISEILLMVEKQLSYSKKTDLKESVEKENLVKERLGMILYTVFEKVKELPQSEYSIAQFVYKLYAQCPASIRRLVTQCLTDKLEREARQDKVGVTKHERTFGISWEYKSPRFAIFVGEMYMLNFVTSKTVSEFLDKLLLRHAQHLEIICELLLTIGDKLESEVPATSNKLSNNKTTEIFLKLKKIYHKDRLSPESKSLLQSLLKLRDANWQYEIADESNVSSNSKATSSVRTDANGQCIPEMVPKTLDSNSEANRTCKVENALQNKTRLSSNLVPPKFLAGSEANSINDLVVKDTAKTSSKRSLKISISTTKNEENEVEFEFCSEIPIRIRNPETDSKISGLKQKIEKLEIDFKTTSTCNEMLTSASSAILQKCTQTKEDLNALLKDSAETFEKFKNQEIPNTLSKVQEAYKNVIRDLHSQNGCLTEEQSKLKVQQAAFIEQKSAENLALKSQVEDFVRLRAEDKKRSAALQEAILAYMTPNTSD